ncbi:aspartate carbamoyltransferase [Candidatus Soleaferrea massiliensis]|uniref:aspartate carbamoyltransferase n=1 Tax=Candidatus Soleaferrea massiliensis TaxID=1470354 RepID=UPI00058AF17C|nr:aspartate carbamoyltransferase [Candidatus Soleaferrea massiliensis]
MLPASLIDLSDFSSEEWQKIVSLALKIKEHPEAYFGRCEGKILATLFYEPSTRTQMSFQTAMLRLGGQTIGFDNPMNSSVAKGENLRDTIKIISGYADILVIRHPMEGAAKAAALNADCPVINAGDGGHLHPTQTLTDLVTLMQEKGRLDHLTIGLCGDLKNGRTVHSLIKTLAPFQNRFVLISTKDLCIPQYIRDILDANGSSYEEVFSLEEAISELDVLYMTRIQKERFASQEEYDAQKDVYVLDKEKLSHAKGSLRILHPLPRVDEITVDVDDDSRAVYFKQAVNGVYARMALILTLLSSEEKTPVPTGKEIKTATCRNTKCITHTEPYLPSCFQECGDMLICDYCEDRFLI